MGSVPQQVYLQFNHNFWHLKKAELRSEVGQPGILTGDSRVSHTRPKGYK